MLGIAGSFYDPSQGSVRPVYLHEACHALIARTFGLASQGGWLHEGLANYYQLQWGKKDSGICPKPSGCRRLVPLADSWTVVRLDEKLRPGRTLSNGSATRKERLLPAIRAMAKQGSSSFAPIAQAHFGTSLVVLEREWIDWLKTR